VGLVEKAALAYKCLRWLGWYTLEIYVLHLYLLGWGLGSGYERIFSTAIIGMVSSLAIAALLRQSAFLKRILFGQFQK
jgi:hypothetical protein